MARDRVNIAYVEAEGQVLDDVRGFEITDEASNAEPQRTMTRAGRALGYSKGQIATEFTITSLIGNPREYDWHSKLRNKTLFDMSYEEEDGGQRWALLDVRVVSIGKGHEVEGESTEQIRCYALQHFPEPS